MIIAQMLKVLLKFFKLRLYLFPVLEAVTLLRVLSIKCLEP